jgi:hypothetical protein
MKKLYPTLMYAGALPFIFCAACFLLHWESIPLLGKTSHILSVYGLIIASFMAGSHWGKALNMNGPSKKDILIASNLNAIFLWASFLLLEFHFHLILVVLMISFLASLWNDKKLLQASLIHFSYFFNRCIITAIVITTLIIARMYS